MKTKSTFAVAVAVMTVLMGAQLAAAEGIGSTTPPSPCPAGQYMNNGSCLTPAQGCTQYGGSWTGSTCQPNNASPNIPPPGGMSSSSPIQPPPPPPQFQGNSSAAMPPYRNTDNGDAQYQKQQAQMDKMQQQQQQRMSSQMKQMSKQLQSAITLFTKAQTKLQKSGLSLSNDCTQALTDAQNMLSSLQSASPDESGAQIGDTMMGLQQCRMQASQLAQAPTVMKTLTRAHDKLLKKNMLSDSDKQDWDTLIADYATLKSGNFDDSDVFSFFDDARSIMESYGMNTGSIPQMQPPRNQDQNQGGNNMGAAVFGAFKNITGFFSNLTH